MKEYRNKGEQQALITVTLEQFAFPQCAVGIKCLVKQIQEKKVPRGQVIRAFYTVCIVLQAFPIVLHLHGRVGLWQVTQAHTLGPRTGARAGSAGSGLTLARQHSPAGDLYFHYDRAASPRYYRRAAATKRPVNLIINTFHFLLIPHNKSPPLFHWIKDFMTKQQNH